MKNQIIWNFIDGRFFSPLAAQFHWLLQLSNRSLWLAWYCPTRISIFFKSSL